MLLQRAGLDRVQRTMRRTITVKVSKVGGLCVQMESAAVGWASAHSCLNTGLQECMQSPLETPETVVCQQAGEWTACASCSACAQAFACAANAQAPHAWAACCAYGESGAGRRSHGRKMAAASARIAGSGGIPARL